MSGQIVIGFTIGKDGEVSNVRPLDVGLFGCRSMNSDNPALQQAAIAAVKQWKLRPFMLPAQPGDAPTPVEAAAAVALPFDFHPTSTVAPSAGMVNSRADSNRRFSMRFLLVGLWAAVRNARQSRR